LDRCIQVDVGRIGEQGIRRISRSGSRVIWRAVFDSIFQQSPPHEVGLQQRTVVVEFESYDRALAAHESEAYKKALQALGSGAERDFRIVEGA
jgi:uncharacterized protein (DUF1330 family)